MHATVNGLRFNSKFDSGNLASAVPVIPPRPVKYPSKSAPDLEFDLLIKPDAAGTDFERKFRSWFFFSVKGDKKANNVMFNIQNLSHHSHVFTNHMYPVFMISDKQRWQKIKDKPSFADVGENARLTFTHCIKASQTVYFAMCYPYPYKDIVSYLKRINERYSFVEKKDLAHDEIYYHQETLCISLDKKSVDLITITSTWGMSTERETRLEHLFPDQGKLRPYRFPNKKVIFISARVHPGETSSSYVLDGIISSLINKEDPGAALLRKKFVFKLIPVLNPDGVVHGHYRTDLRGVNLNRVYEDPSVELHPSIYGASALIKYYHEQYVGKESIEATRILADGQVPCPEEDKKVDEKLKKRDSVLENRTSGIFLYLDLHAHASRKGFFVYGNHFPKVEDCVETQVFAKLMEINCKSFSYDSCDFSEASMFVQDKTGNGSREGAGRVWVMKHTGILYSYTFEAHYNTGHVETCIPRMGDRLVSKHWINYTPPAFSTSYEAVGRALLQSMLDLNGPNSWSQLHTSSFKSLPKIRESLRKELVCKQSAKKATEQMSIPVVRSSGACGKVTGTIKKEKKPVEQSGSSTSRNVTGAIPKEKKPVEQSGSSTSRNVTGAIPKEKKPVEQSGSSTSRNVTGAIPKEKKPVEQSGSSTSRNVTGAIPKEKKPVEQSGSSTSRNVTGAIPKEKKPVEQSGSSTSRNVTGAIPKEKKPVEQSGSSTSRNVTGAIPKEKKPVEQSGSSTSRNVTGAIPKAETSEKKEDNSNTTKD